MRISIRRLVLVCDGDASGGSETHDDNIDFGEIGGHGWLKNTGYRTQNAEARCGAGT